MAKTLQQKIEELEIVVGRLECENYQIKKDIDTIEQTTKKYMEETDNVLGLLQEELDKLDDEFHTKEG